MIKKPFIYAFTASFLLGVMLLLPLISSAELTSFTKVNTTTLSINNFQVEVKDSNVSWMVDGKTFYPEYTSASKYNIVTDSKTQAVISKTLKPLTNVTFRVNKLEELIGCSESFYSKVCSKEVLDFSKFESKNIITSKEIVGVQKNKLGEWTQCLIEGYVVNIPKIESCLAKPEAYDIIYYGTIVDLDPSLTIVYTTSNAPIFMNRTEITAKGVREETTLINHNFNEPNEGTYYVRDNSLSNNFGTLGNSTGGNQPTYSATGGFDGSGGYTFDGGDFMNLTTTSSIVPSKFSISIWVKSNTAGTYQGYFSNLLNTGVKGFGLVRISTNYYSFLVSNGTTGNHVTSLATYTDSNWHHLVGTYDGTTAILYLDGVYQKSVTTSLSSSNVPMILGRYYVDYAPDYYLNGSLDEAKLFNRVLTASEVSALYNGTINNSNYIGKYANTGDFKSLVYYNSTPSLYWHTTSSIADTYSNRSGIVGANNELNTSYPNLVSYWKLDGNYLDSKGSANGIANGTNNATGSTSGAMYFNGATDWVNFSQETPYQVYNKSLSLWYYTTAYAGAVQGFFSLNSANYYFGLSTNGRYYISYHNSTSSQRALSSANGDENLNQWTNVIFVQSVSGSNVNNYIYENGILIYNTTQTDGYGSAWGHEARLGRVTVSNYFSGFMNDVAFYNSTLTQSEIDAVYKAGLSHKANTNITLYTRTATAYNISDSGLVSQWDFNNDNSTSVFDRLGLNNATLGNGTAGTSPVLDESNGTIGSGYYFDGVDDIITVNNLSSLSPASNNFTIASWFKTSKSYSATVGDIVRNYGLNTSNIYALSVMTDNKIRLIARGSNNLIVQVVNQGPTVNDGKWHHVVAMRNGSSLTVYVDNVLIGTTYNTSLGDINTTAGYKFHIGGFKADTGYGGYFNGSIDEVRYYNRSLSASEVSDLYNMGSSVIAWNDPNFTSEGAMSDGVEKVSSNYGNFFQFKEVFNSNTTDSSPYVLNHSVVAMLGYTLPTVTFVSQSPVDITSTNVIGGGVNVTYNIEVGNGGQSLNLSTILLSYKINSTTESNLTYINGTSSDGWHERSYISNSSSNFLFNLDDNEVLPSTNNLNERTMENTTHAFMALSNQNYYQSVRLFNVSNNKSYGWFEVMANSTSASNPMPIYYCNSSYTHSNAPTVNSNCGVFVNLAPSPTFSHCHSDNSCHQVIPFIVNTTSGTIGGIKVTPTSYFIMRGVIGDGWNVYYISNVSRPDTIQYSSNSGNTWTNQSSITVDAHLHQFSGLESLYYYACANDTYSPVGSTCSSIRQEILEQGGLPPSAVVITSPTNTTYSSIIIPINYTASVSPNGYAISNYTVSLVSPDYIFDRTLVVNNGTTLSYAWNMLYELAGSYRINVTVCDNQSSCTTSYSDVFTFIPDTTPPTVELISPSTDMNVDLTFLIEILATDPSGIYRTEYDFDYADLPIYNYTQPTTQSLPNGDYNIFIRSWDNFLNLREESIMFTVGNVISEQECPTGTVQSGSYANGTIKCVDGGSIANVTTSTTSNSLCPEDIFGYYDPSLPSIKQAGCNKWKNI